MILPVLAWMGYALVAFLVLIAIDKLFDGS